jgi:hypothetical protein
MEKMKFVIFIACICTTFSQSADEGIKFGLNSDLFDQILSSINNFPIPMNITENFDARLLKIYANLTDLHITLNNDRKQLSLTFKNPDNIELSLNGLSGFLNGKMTLKMGGLVETGDFRIDLSYLTLDIPLIFNNVIREKEENKKMVEITANPIYKGIELDISVTGSLSYLFKMIKPLIIQTVKDKIDEFIKTTIPSLVKSFNEFPAIVTISEDFKLDISLVEDLKITPEGFLVDHQFLTPSYKLGPKVNKLLFPKTYLPNIDPEGEKVQIYITNDILNKYINIIPPLMIKSEQFPENPFHIKLTTDGLTVLFGNILENKYGKDKLVDIQIELNKESASKITLGTTSNINLEVILTLFVRTDGETSVEAIKFSTTLSIKNLAFSISKGLILNADIKSISLLNSKLVFSDVQEFVLDDFEYSLNSFLKRQLLPQINPMLKNLKLKSPISWLNLDSTTVSVVSDNNAYISILTTPLLNTEKLSSK